MPNPASSGTGYFDVTAWLKLFGEKDGWAYMDRLHDNIAQYTHSGSKPCKQAAAGEFPIGIAFEYRAAKLKESGAPIDLVFPKEGLGWDVEATAIMKGTRNLEAARKLADWSASRSANELYEKNFAIVAYPGVARPNPLIPANYEQLLVRQDLKWSAANRDRILTEWTRRYDGKSEPRK
ncbi:extracellular solute-binding protein [Microvirgula aerodenitrificans]|nr:extracellular solute-binding protein [Microvirgula aerodenitrificans]